MAKPFPVVIHHNPACGTSRNTLELIRKSGREPQVIEYLKSGWTRPELERLLVRMGKAPRDVLRVRGTPAEALGLAESGLGLGLGEGLVLQGGEGGGIDGAGDVGPAAVTDRQLPCGGEGGDAGEADHRARGITDGRMARIEFLHLSPNYHATGNREADRPDRAPIESRPDDGGGAWLSASNFWILADMSHLGAVPERPPRLA